MNRFALLLDRLQREPSRHGKLRLMTDYFRTVPDPNRGFGLAALTGALSFRYAKPGLINALIGSRVDPVLFDLSYDFVGDLSETVALLWPASASSSEHPPSLTEVVRRLAETGKIDLPRVLAGLLDGLDETGRWALLKLITGSMRIGASARLAQQALAELGGKSANDIEDIWHGLEPPYLDLFAWLEGREPRPVMSDPVPFCPAMLAHALSQEELVDLQPADFCAEWKWDGIRVQAAVGQSGVGEKIIRLFSRTGEDISNAFPDLVDMLAELPYRAFSLDGELLIRRDGLVQSFGVLQQRLNRKRVSAALLANYPAHIRAYDLLSFEGEDLRALAFFERRRRLEAFVGGAGAARLDLSP